jgi:hypothetical protein
MVGGRTLATVEEEDESAGLHRASEVIRRLRSVLRKTPFEMSDLDFNQTSPPAI